MILHLYFARRFAMAFVMITGVLFALVMLIDAVEQTRKFGGLDIGWQKIFGLTLLNAPQTINLILPLIVILATITLFITLARSSFEPTLRAAPQRSDDDDLPRPHRSQLERAIRLRENEAPR